MAIKALFFDAGNTLLYFDYERFSHYLSPHGYKLEIDFIKEKEAFVRLLINEHSKNVAGSNDNDRLRCFFKELLKKCGVTTDFEKILSKLEEEHRIKNFWSTTEASVAETLKYLKQKYRLGVISNSDGRIAQLLESVGLSSYFDQIIDSHNVGIEKPSPEIFQLALSAFNCIPEETVYVGDLYDIDIAPALALKMTGFLIDPYNIWKIKTQKIKKISDLTNLF